jgi:hypothetical protein
MTHSISIGEPEVAGSRVKVDVTASRRLRRFLSDDTFWVEYDESVEQCPDGILIVPAVTTLAPVAWAAGATITVDEIDSTFAESLPELLSAYQDQYPSIFTEEVEPTQYGEKKHYDTNDEQSAHSSSMLFSGGVDSLSSYLKHREEHPALFTIHGSDLSLEYDQGWQRIQSSVNSFADSEGVPLHTVKSNFREILSYRFLDHHFTSSVNRNWWGAVHYGTGLPALCAPITHEYGYGFVYQGSGYTSDSDYPTAQPSFVHCLRWEGTEARITEAGMTRQEKVAYLRVS